MRRLDEGFLKAAKERFGERLVLLGTHEDRAALVKPLDAGEVALLAGLADRHAVELVALGAGTGPEAPKPEGNRVGVGFDLMRKVALPEPSALEVEAEPGATWIELEDHLRAAGRGLRVYPTSAPRATVGGWLARDGLGVGSFEYGWLGENVVSVEVVLPGGERRLLSGEDLPAEGGIIVRATLKLRESGYDLPFAAAFDDASSLARAATAVHSEGVPLWHLGFSNPSMSFAGGLRNAYLLSGAYPADRAPEVRHRLEKLLVESGGETLPTVEAFRAWGERFFPAKPFGGLPQPGRALVPVFGLADALRGLESLGLAVAGSVARGGDALLLAFLPGEQRGRPSSLGDPNRERMAEIVGAVGGRAYDPASEAAARGPQTLEEALPAGEEGGGRWKRVLLATDGSGCAETAARTAAEISHDDGAQLHVVHVWRDIPTARFHDFVRAELERQAREVLDGQVRSLESAGASVAGAHLREGNAVEEILKTRDELGADLIVVGNRGLGPIKRAVLGSVSEGVLRRANDPVLVVGADTPAEAKEKSSVG